MGKQATEEHTMRVGGVVKNRKARLPARDTDKHTCGAVCAHMQAHTWAKEA